MKTYFGNNAYSFVGKTFVVTTRYWVHVSGILLYRNPGDVLVVIDSFVEGSSYCILCLHSDGVNKLFSSHSGREAFCSWIKEIE